MWTYTILIIILCIALNALLAGIEIAFVSVNKALVRQLAKEGSVNAKILLALKERPERTLSTIQIGITLLGAISAAVGGSAAGLRMIPYLQNNFQLSLTSAEIIAILFIVIPITYLSVVIGEITPKALAIRNPYYFASTSAPALKLLSKVLYPLVRICEISTKALLKTITLGKRQGGEKQDEYETVLTGYRRLPKIGREYMINLGQIQEKTVQEIMLEWEKVDYVTSDLDLSEIVDITISSGHTRLPVVEDGRVIGLLNTKEILALSKSEDSNWKSMMHHPVRLEEKSSPLKALTSLQRNRVHMGIVIDNTGKPIGVVTIEDIIEEVMGEIYDEDDEGSLQKILNK